MRRSSLRPAPRSAASPHTTAPLHTCTCCEQAGSELDGVSQWLMLSRGAAGARQTVLLEAPHLPTSPHISPYLPTPPRISSTADCAARGKTRRRAATRMNGTLKYGYDYHLHRRTRSQARTATGRRASSAPATSTRLAPPPTPTVPNPSPYPHGTRTLGDQHATPYYALRQWRWKLLLGDPGADDNRHRSIGNGFWCTGRPS